MSISDKLTTIAENEQKIYNKGYNDGREQGGDSYYDEFWDAYQEKGNRQQYYKAFSGTAWTKNTFKPKYPIKPTYKSGYLNCAQYIFENFNWGNYGNNAVMDFTEFNSMLDFSECTGSAQYAFANARIKNLEVDLSKCTNLNYTFTMANGGAIKNLRVKLGETNTNLTTAFMYFLDDFYVLEGSIIAVSIDLKRCSNLSLNGAKSVLLALKDFTGTDKANTLTVGLHENAWALLDADGTNSPTGTTWKTYVEGKKWLY